MVLGNLTEKCVRNTRTQSHPIPVKNSTEAKKSHILLANINPIEMCLCECVCLSATCSTAFDKYLLRAYCVKNI